MKTKIYFPNLDGLRTIACLMVFCYHSLGIGHNRLGIQNTYIESFLRAFLNGKTGVSIFFVLSGFLITYIILSEIEQSGNLNLGNFYLRRVLRIWPLYLLVIFIIFVLIPLASHFLKFTPLPADIRPSYYVFFLSNLDVLRILESGGVDFSPSTITWSVAIEEQFYVFWPLLFFFTSPTKYKYIFIGVTTYALFFRVSNYNKGFRLYFHSFSAMFDLSVGGAVAYLSLASTWFKNKIAYLSNGGRIIIIGIGLCVMYINALLNSPFVNLLLTVIQTAFFAFFILDQCFNQSSRIKLSQSRVLTGFGKYTYGMYMLHPLVLLVLTTILLRFMHIRIDSVANALICLSVGLPATIFIARLSYVYVEKKFLTLKERVSNGGISFARTKN